MMTPIIPIERASEKLVQALIENDILEVTEDGLKVKEQTHEKKIHTCQITWRRQLV